MAIKKHKILVVSGTRPDTIKLAPLIINLRKNNNFDVTFLVSGQHREMLKQALFEFDISPDINLDVMKHNQTLTEVTCAMLNASEGVVVKVQPDLIITHGDTLTGYIFSLIGFYNRFKVAHVEAGLRTHDIYNPYPEEFIRSSIDSIADYLFPATRTAKKNLLREIKKRSTKPDIYVTGNTIIDALDHITKDISISIKKALKHLVGGRRMILCTLHRRENTGDTLIELLEAIKHIATTRQDVKIAFPVHLRPDLKDQVHKSLRGIHNVILLEPLEYRKMLYLQKKAHLIMTDSGGLQEEATYFRKPIIVLRKATERHEGVKAGAAKLVGVDKDIICKEVFDILDNEEVYNSMTKASNIYGDGKACERMISFLEWKLGLRDKCMREFKSPY